MQMGRCCKCAPIPPLPGTITRSVIPTEIADYEGLATAAWTTMSCTTLSGAYNCLTFHHEVANNKLSGSSYILPPVRYSVHEPSTAGATYDSVGKWDLYSGQFSNARNYLHIGNSSWTTGYPLTVQRVQDACGQFGLINTLLPISGNSHAVFDSTTSVTGIPVAGTSYQGQLPWMGDGAYQNSDDVGGTAGIPVPELAAISPSVSWAPLRGAVPYAIRHRVNGTAVGTLQIAPLYYPSWFVTLTAGDTYELDVWWRAEITRATFYGNIPRKHAIWLPLDKVSNGSYYPPAARSTGSGTGNRAPRALAFSGINFTPNFDPAQHTYEFAFSGGSPSWTLQNGTMTQKVATVGNGVDQWVANITQKNLTWTSPANLPAVGRLQFLMDWNKEHCHLVAYSTTMNEYAVYSPQNSGDYITSTVSTEWGNCSWGPRGCFNQGGATTFELRDHPLDGFKTGSLTSVNPEWPTSVVVTRKAK